MIKNKLSAKLLASIPQGKRNEDRISRKEIIRRELSALNGKTFKNPSFPIGITIKGASLNEIAHHASGDYKSTVAALHIKYALTHATVSYIGLPKYGRQMNKFAAWITIVLHCDIEGVGKAKLTVIDSLERGEKGKLDLIAYCLTKEKEQLQP